LFQRKPERGELSAYFSAGASGNSIQAFAECFGKAMLRGRVLAEKFVLRIAL
jgi:hypothetical protein